MAGVAGFEPTNARIKIVCLTAWRYPYASAFVGLSISPNAVFTGWGGRIRTYGMLESESNALPLGDTPSSFAEILSGVIEEDRTLDLQSHNLAFYQLNYDHHIMVLPEGFEPSTSALEGQCSIQLSYGSKVEQVKGIGPSQPAWKASVLPLNYTCKCFLSLPHRKIIVKKILKKNIFFSIKHK